MRVKVSRAENGLPRRDAGDNANVDNIIFREGVNATLHPLTISNDTLHTMGILVLTLVAVEYGGITVLRIVTGETPRTP